MAHKIRGLRVEEYAYYDNKLRQNVGLETWKWRQIVTSQRAHPKYKWPPYATEWNPSPWKYSAYATEMNGDANIAMYLSVGPNINSQQNLTGFV